LHTWAERPTLHANTRASEVPPWNGNSLC
jgi:hypothetical protein